jgi:hypothetical protein
MAIMIILLFGAIGLAVDAAVGYLYAIRASRSAAAAALAGVVFMPDQFDTASAQPPGSGNDATDRARGEATKNRFTDGIDGVTVTPAKVPGYPNQLQVTVSKRTPLFFMQLFGFSGYSVQRTAIAEYLPPLTIGQPGSHLGATAATLGRSPGGDFWFLRTEGWGTDRGQGDAFTPHPQSTSDVHAISQDSGTEVVSPADPSLPSRGGYNYRVTIGAGGGIVQVYNAAFAPDNGAGGPNYCDNVKSPDPATNCAPTGSSYWLHEEDGINFATTRNYATMQYTIFRVPNVFARTDDIKQSQLKVRPIDARNWNLSPPTYRDVNAGITISQTYSGAPPGSPPANMKIYHSWIDAANSTGAGYGDASSPSLVQWPTVYAGYAGYLPQGTYRLRVDTLSSDGTPPPNDLQNVAHKAYAVRVTNTDGVTECTTCALSAWTDLCLYTPVSGTSFALALFQVPPAYRGKTVNIDIWDIGDIGSGTRIDVDILDPTRDPLDPIAYAAPGIKIYNMGLDRSTAGNQPPGTDIYPLGWQPDPTRASFIATDAGVYHSDNQWFRIVLPIPGSYSPSADPNTWWWSLRYRSAVGTTAVDTVTFAIGLKGSPSRLIQS